MTTIVPSSSSSLGIRSRRRRRRRYRQLSFLLRSIAFVAFAFVLIAVPFHFTAEARLGGNGNGNGEGGRELNEPKRQVLIGYRRHPHPHNHNDRIGDLRPADYVDSVLQRKKRSSKMGPGLKKAGAVRAEVTEEEVMALLDDPNVLYVEEDVRVYAFEAIDDGDDDDGSDGSGGEGANGGSQSRRRQRQLQQQKEEQRQREEEQGEAIFDTTMMTMVAPASATATAEQQQHQRRRNAINLSAKRETLYPWGIVASQADTPENPWPPRHFTSIDGVEKETRESWSASNNATGSFRAWTSSACGNPDSFKGENIVCVRFLFPRFLVATENADSSSCDAHLPKTVDDNFPYFVLIPRSLSSSLSWQQPVRQWASSTRACRWTTPTRRACTT